MGMDLLEAYMMIEDEVGIPCEDVFAFDVRLGLESTIGDVADAFSSLYFEREEVPSLNERAAIKQRILESVIASFADVSGVALESVNQNTEISSLELD